MAHGQRDSVNLRAAVREKRREKKDRKLACYRCIEVMRGSDKAKSASGTRKEGPIADLRQTKSGSWRRDGMFQVIRGTYEGFKELLDLCVVEERPEGGVAMRAS